MENFLDPYNEKRILVTGGLGFIGSNLVRHLARSTNSKISIVDSLAKDMGGNRFNINGIERPIEICTVDLNDRKRMEELVVGTDYIFNLAGQVSHVDSQTDPFQDLHSNYSGHLVLLEACRQLNPNVRIIYASTRQVYGRAQSLPIREDHPLNPVDVNGIHKLASEMCHLHYHRVYGINAIVLRLTNTYGPRQLVRHSRQGFIAGFIRKVLNGDEIEIFGDGQQLRGLNYVDDVVKAFFLAGTCNQFGRVLNLGAKQSYTLKYIVETLLRMNGSGSYRFTDFPKERSPIDVGNVLIDFSLFRNATGWEPTVSLENGLQECLAFYKANREHYWN